MDWIITFYWYITMINKLNEVAELVTSKARNINCGGCCVFASLVLDHVQNMTPVRISVLSNWFGRENSIDVARTKVTCNQTNEWNENGIYFGHVILEFDHDGVTYFYDSDGVTKKDQDYRAGDQVDGYLTTQECKELAEDVNWNRMFDRANIPTMKATIDTFFAQFDVDLPQAA
jgi:hypothetical protein